MTDTQADLVIRIRHLPDADGEMRRYCGEQWKEQIMIVEVPSLHVRGYCTHPLLRDATVSRLETSIGQARVYVDAGCDRQIAVAFHGVVAIDAIHPEGMRFATVTCWDADEPPYRFEFANWFQPGDDWDPWMAECQLDVIATAWTVIDSGLILHRKGAQV